MNGKNLPLKFGFVILLVAVCLYSIFLGDGLKQGIDLRGGHALLFRVEGGKNAQGDQVREVISTLKRRIDPLGTKSLEWTPQGQSLFEVRMPAPDDETLARKALYQEQLQVISDNNYTGREIRNFLEMDPAEQARVIEQFSSQEQQAAKDLTEKYRQDKQQLQSAEMSDEDRKAALIDLENRWEKLKAALEDSANRRSAMLKDLAQRNRQVNQAEADLERLKDQRFQLLKSLPPVTTATTQPSPKIQAIEEQIDQAEDAMEIALVAFEGAFDAVQATNISIGELQSVAEAYISPREADALADQKGKKAAEREVRRGREAYANRIQNMRVRYPFRTDEIDQAIAAYEAWDRTRTTLDDPSDLVRMIRKSGVLEFRAAPFSPYSGRAEFALSMGEYRRYVEELQKVGPVMKDANYLWFKIHDDEENYPGLCVADYGGERYMLLYHQKDHVMLQNPGNREWELESARPDVDRLGKPAVGFTFDAAGANRFADLTARHQEKVVAILLDNEVYSAPRIRETISKRGIISGDFSPAEVRELARTLQAGSLPARVDPTPESVRTFGAAIGQENAQKGQSAALYGLIAVAAFMLLYYLMAGSIADVALLLNVILILGALSMIDQRLTLPGIAGVILTIGISVDANVLIFERLREEQARNQSVRMALQNAYQRAFSAIFDANLTTLLVCVILGWVGGTPEVKGFAVTLGFGVVFSMFTALLVTRWIFQALLRLGMLKNPVKMIQGLKPPKVNWMGKRHLFWVVSTIMVVLGIASISWQGSRIWGTEFTGGTQSVIKLADDALISGQLPNDERVRNKFFDGIKTQVSETREQLAAATDDAQRQQLQDKLAKLEQLGASSTKVETQIIETRVASFIRAHDNDGDEQISRAEAQQEGLSDEFFAKVDLNGDGTLVRSELEQTLPATRYQVSTTVTDLELIRDVISEAFSGQLVERTKLNFDFMTSAVVPKMDIEIGPAGWVEITPSLRRRMAREYRDELIDFDGGVLIVLDNINPPISRNELEARIREIRLQPDYAGQLTSEAKPIELQGGEQGYSSIAVAVKDPSQGQLDAETVGQGYRQLWKTALNDGLKRADSSEGTVTGPTIAADLARNAIMAVVLSWLAMIIYLWLRFGSAQWGLAAVLCLVHDVIIVVGLVAASGWAYQYLGFLGIRSFKVDLAMVAAILTVVGYSVNDTIVVFDRIRENRGKLTTISGNVINESINQTLPRTLLTSFTTFLVVIIMYVAGGEGIRAFSFALLMGVVFGTYSSIAIASPLLLGFKRAVIAKVAAPAEA